ncbi:Cyclin-D-binding Myb-like transcription factor 1 [Rhizoctonia solani]|uniref:Cyclin-D-binding Myb-like transcription factor 1 n=1 Tax=Rhizoctonia solani TaxID=456999 RepID=A0A0K6FW89_9AGAM|nr:Cyclin-D-binding Myb-like transcription factor 1 [Rhizoctonia solani]
MPNLTLASNEIDGKTLDELKSLTVQKSLEVLEHVQALLRAHDADLPTDNKESNAPRVALGTRDLAVLRTLASIIFGWGTTPLLVALYLQVNPPPTPSSDLPSKPTVIRDIDLLIAGLTSLLWSSDIYPGSSTQPTHLFPSHITKILITSHITDMLRAGISIGWLPESNERAQQIVSRLLKILPASQAIVSLGAVSQPMRSSPETGSRPLPTPSYVQKAASVLLSQQVLRPDGVSGLCAAVFGEGDEVAPLVKLERIARVLGAVPAQMDREIYMRTIIPNIINLLSPAKPDFQSQSAPTTYKQAAAFTLSRMLKMSKSLTLKIISPVIHGRFFPESTSQDIPSLSDTISTLTTLFTSTDPSPFLAQIIIEPILVPLYNLSAHLDAQRVSDPALKESVRGLIRTWARLVGREEAIEGLWSIIQGSGGWGVGTEAKWCWDVGEEGLEISRAGIRRFEDDNPLSLRPVPVHFAELLKSLERKDVASTVFVRTLNAYQASRLVDTDPLKTLLYLRLILEMQQKLGSGVLTEPEHILQFVAHVIEPKKPYQEPERARDPIRIVEQDSDDEAQAEEPQTQDEMIMTAVTLLLSILEANENMSTLTSPLLAMIFDYLEPITNHEDESIRSLAREARLVLISRRSIAEVTPSATDADRPALQTYQEALRLIQDPILPVRAHGLHMLRQLVVPPKPTKGAPPQAPPELNPALVPAILDVFLQSIQEEDSFVFLNAVQGLSAMANRLGKDIIQNLVRMYADGVEPGRPMERVEMDKRVRVGEALVQVVRSCGDTLGNYVDMLVPPLFRVVRAQTLPTVLRSSALSILAQCVETSSVSITAWIEDILSGMLDILQLESVQAVPLSRKSREETRENEVPKLDALVDSNPQDADSKLPPLRRSALLCFALVIRSMVEGVYEGTRSAQLGDLRSKTIAILDYVRITDSDPVVRTQAAETLSLVKQLGRAELGLEVPEVQTSHPKQSDISSVIMHPSPPASALIEKKRKKKSKKRTSDASLPSVGGAPNVTASSTIDTDDGINQAIQTALDHATAIATPSSAVEPFATHEGPSKSKKRAAASNEPTHDGSEPRKSKKKKLRDNSAVSSSPSMSPPTANQTGAIPDPNVAHLVSAYIPATMGGSHIPIDPALTGNEHMMQQHSHPQGDAHNPAFMSAVPTVANGTPQHHPDALVPGYMFNQDTDLSSLGSNEELLRALQGFDLSKLSGVFKYPESMTTDNTTPSHHSNDPGPSNLGNVSQADPSQSASGNRSRSKKTVAPQPGSQLVNPEHADILATHWLNPAKLAELVKEQGLVYKKGKFSAIEEHQIEEALQSYAKARSLTPQEIDTIIFSKGKKAKEEYSTFWSEITRAVPQRPIIAVYHHVRRTHHPMKQQGKWTPEEDAIVIAAVAELGQKWEQISSRVGRMSSDCRDRYRNHLVDQDARVVGPWTKEEEEELTRIVMELTVERGLQADNDVLWSEVSERMGGRRTRQQVRIKWTDALNKRVKNAGERPRWSAQDAYILVHKVASMPVQDDTEIDWKLLPDPQWNLWSAHQLQRRWFGLKKTLKDSDTMPHSEIVAILQNKFRDPPEQPNAPRRYETKKARNVAIGREFITDEDDNFDDFGDPDATHDLFSQTADGNPIDPDLVRAAQKQLEAVLEIASQQAAASGSGSHDA